VIQVLNGQFAVFFKLSDQLGGKVKEQVRWLNLFHLKFSHEVKRIVECKDPTNPSAKKNLKVCKQKF
jgi:hypothetical protein